MWILAVQGSAPLTPCLRGYCRCKKRSDDEDYLELTMQVGGMVIGEFYAFVISASLLVAVWWASHSVLL